MVSKAGLLFAIVVLAVATLLEKFLLPRLLLVSQSTAPDVPEGALAGRAFWSWIALVAAVSAAILFFWPQHGSHHDETLCIIGYGGGILMWLAKKASWIDEEAASAGQKEITFATTLGLIVGAVAFFLVHR